MNKSSIRIGPRFFAIEKQNYSNWKSAIIREGLQNAADSTGCTRIDFEVEEKENSAILTIKDNGRGMNRDVLTNVFLVMGESLKDNGAVGGFGKAKIVLCFSQIRYQIISNDYLLEGCGAEYEIKDNPYTKGCIFKIETEKADWIGIINSILSKSSLRQLIYINGERFTNTLHRGRLTRNLSFGDMYVNKSATPRLIVRAGGTWMFSRSISAKAQVCIEINPEEARKVLTANRDGLQWEQEKELDRLLNELASDTSSALKDKTRKFIKFADKSKCFVAKKKNKGGVIIPMPVAAPQEGQRFVEKTVLGGGNTVMRPTVEGFATAAFTNYDNDIEEFVAEYKKTVDPVLASMLLSNESESVEIAKIAKLYDPEVMSETGTRFKLLKIWKVINEIVLDIYTEWRGGEYPWAVGFLFSDDAEAQLRTEEGVHYVLLNPVDKAGKMAYSVNSKEDIYSLIVLACHEISHMGEDCKYHSEAFASVFTQLMRKTLGQAGEILRAVKAAK